jgi:citrate lyase subunit beta/citryl-CoA lyase
LKTRPYHLCRTWLFIGGVDREAQDSAVESGADVLIQELEDFTPPGLRSDARRISAGLIAQWKQAGRVAAVRVNPLAGDGQDDLAAVMPGAPDVILLPKVDGPDCIVELDATISRLETINGLDRGAVAIVPNVESASGLRLTYDICRASPRVVACLVASEDMAADLGAERSIQGAELHHVRSRFLVDCTAAGIPAIDCPYTWQDMDGLKAEALCARQLGYRAKSAVDGAHAKTINTLLTPGDDDVTQARRLVAAFASARQKGEARVLLDGSLVEIPAVANAQRLLQRARELAKWD